MNPLEFLKKVDSLRINRDQLLEIYKDQETADYYFNSFLLQGDILGIGDDANIDDLIKSGIADSIKIFSFSFNKEIDLIDGYNIFGENETNSLAIRQADDKVYEILYTDIGDFKSGVVHNITHTIPAAKDQFSFLSGLYVIADFNQRVIHKDIMFRDNIRKKEFSELASRLAGGDEYKLFWNGLLNVT
jgi:hypothetical protein